MVILLLLSFHLDYKIDISWVLSCTRDVEFASEEQFILTRFPLKVETEA